MAEISNEELRQQLLGLFKYIQKVKEEIAAIDHPAYEDHDLERMSDQLDAIVQATEDATNTIMQKVEDNDNALEEIRKTPSGRQEVSLRRHHEQRHGYHPGLFFPGYYRPTGQQGGEIHHLCGRSRRNHHRHFGSRSPGKRRGQGRREDGRGNCCGGHS